MTFEILEISPQPFAYLHRTAPMEGIGQTMGECFDSLGKIFAQTGVTPVGPPLSYYTAVDNETTTFDVGFPVRAEDRDKLAKAGLEIGVSPTGKAMKGVHTGSYDTLPQTYSAMHAEMAKHNLKPGEAMWEVYKSMPETPPEKTVTEVYWPVS